VLEITRDSFGMYLSQVKYAEEILDNTGITACKSTMTPTDTSSKLSASTSPPYL
jgi:hypothetical protein